MKRNKLIFYLFYPLLFLNKKLQTLWSVLKSEDAKRKVGKFGSGSRVMPETLILGGDNISIGENSYIGRGCILSAWTTYRGTTYSPHISIGNNVSLGEYNHITSVNGIRIGNGVLTGRWVTITDNSHGNNTDELELRPSERKLFSKGPVEICDNVWIGDKVTILPNIRIGEGAIIGANSVVTKDVPEYCIAAGNPARIIRKLNGDKKQN